MSVSFSVKVAATPRATPGSGFSGATAQPDAIGAGLGSTQKAIARWDVVPYQAFAGKLVIGVVAFHIGTDGIDFVRFIVEGGSPIDVPAMTLNPTTNVVEYCCQLDA